MIDIKKLGSMYELKLTTKVGNGMTLYSYSNNVADGLLNLRYCLIGAAAAIASTDWLEYSRQREALDEAEAEVAERRRVAMVAERDAA